MRPDADDHLPHDVSARRGTEGVVSAGLLAAARRDDAPEVAVDPVGAPTASNGRAAVCAATLVIPAGRCWGPGDASPRMSRDAGDAPGVGGLAPGLPSGEAAR